MLNENNGQCSLQDGIIDLTMRDLDRDKEDFDLDCDDLCTDVAYLNLVHDEQAHTKKMSKSWNAHVTGQVI